MACGYPVSDCCLTASCTTLSSLGLSTTPRVLVRVSGLPTSLYGFTDSKMGPTFVCKQKCDLIYHFLCIRTKYNAPIKNDFVHKLCKIQSIRTYNDAGLNKYRFQVNINMSTRFFDYSWTNNSLYYQCLGTQTKKHTIYYIFFKKFYLEGMKSIYFR
jgi:hypothetical protein